MKHLFLISLLLLGPSPVLLSQDAEYLMPVEFDINYKSEVYAVIIDARIARQYRRSRIPGAVGIEKMAKLEMFADTMDTETPVYIYCDGESRSRTVAEYLAGEGFSRLAILRGGIREWEAAGMPLDHERLRRRK
ncbi:MAG: rhodanese-like domain-containing protein [Bacteroidales bacterium]|nr:rhodanese-like domain-containing protein [Bacteroidales bacterium]